MRSPAYKKEGAIEEKKHAALEASWAKLKHYYSKTDSISGDLYAVNTVFSPLDKYAFFLTENREPQYCTRYRQFSRMHYVHTRIITKSSSLPNYPLEKCEY